MISMEKRFPYEESDNWSQDIEERRRWTEALEETGLYSVKTRLKHHAAGSAGAIAIGTQTTIAKGFVEQWVAWHDNQAAKAEVERQERMLAAANASARAAKGSTRTAIAALVAAAIAAIATCIQAYVAWQTSPPRHTPAKPGFDFGLFEMPNSHVWDVVSRPSIQEN